MPREDFGESLLIVSADDTLLKKALREDEALVNEWVGRTQSALNQLGIPANAAATSFDQLRNETESMARAFIRAADDMLILTGASRLVGMEATRMVSRLGNVTTLLIRFARHPLTLVAAGLGAMTLGLIKAIDKFALLTSALEKVNAAEQTTFDLLQKSKAERGARLDVIEKEIRVTQASITEKKRETMKGQIEARFQRLMIERDLEHGDTPEAKALHRLAEIQVREERRVKAVAEREQREAKITAELEAQTKAHEHDAALAEREQVDKSRELRQELLQAQQEADPFYRVNRALRELRQERASRLEEERTLQGLLGTDIATESELAEVRRRGIGVMPDDITLGRARFTSAAAFGGLLPAGAPTQQNREDKQLRLAEVRTKEVERVHELMRQIVDLARGAAP